MLRQNAAAGEESWSYNALGLRVGFVVLDCFFEALDAFAKTLAEIGKLARPEDQEGDHKDDQQV